MDRGWATTILSGGSTHMELEKKFKKNPSEMDTKTIEVLAVMRKDAFLRKQARQIPGGDKMVAGYDFGLPINPKNSLSTVSLPASLSTPFKPPLSEFSSPTKYSP
jgi:hypothetical protein